MAYVAFMNGGEIRKASTVSKARRDLETEAEEGRRLGGIR